jgi:hypothetical protein
MSTIASVTVKSKIHFLFFPPPFKKHFEVVESFHHLYPPVEGTSTEENLLMREIEDHPVVSSLCFICAIGRDKAVYRDNLRTISSEE